MGLIHILALLSPVVAAFALFRVEQSRRALRRASRRIERYDRELGIWNTERPASGKVTA